MGYFAVRRKIIRTKSCEIIVVFNFMKQLYEHFYLEKNEIKKMQKNISSELLASFGRQLTKTEDIPARLNESVLN